MCCTLIQSDVFLLWPTGFILLRLSWVFASGRKKWKSKAFSSYMCISDQSLKGFASLIESRNIIVCPRLLREGLLEVTANAIAFSKSFCQLWIGWWTVLSANRTGNSVLALSMQFVWYIEFFALNFLYSTPPPLLFVCFFRNYYFYK